MLCVGGLRAVLLENRCPENALNPDSLAGAGMSLTPELVARIEAALGREGVIVEPEQLRTYECDGLTGRRVVPALVALPRSTARGAGRRPCLPRVTACRSSPAARVPGSPAGPCRTRTESSSRSPA